MTDTKELIERLEGLADPQSVWVIQRTINALKAKDAEIERLKREKELLQTFCKGVSTNIDKMLSPPKD